MHIAQNLPNSTWNNTVVLELQAEIASPEIIMHHYYSMEQGRIALSSTQHGIICNHFHHPQTFMCIHTVHRWQHLPKLACLHECSDCLIDNAHLIFTQHASHCLSNNLPRQMSPFALQSCIDDGYVCLKSAINIIDSVQEIYLTS